MNQVSPPHQPPSLAQLHFQFQRILALRPDAVGWHEALIRWHLPDGTIRGPVDVLPYWLSPNHQAEFTRFTIERAAETLGVHPEARVSINLSPRQVSHPVAVSTLEALRSDVRDRLIVELTEQRMRDMSSLWSSVAALREQCELVVLDDVTRHDMTTRFRDDIPVDGIKLDRSVIFLLGVPDERERTIRFIQRATERFGVVVAEGIEDAAVRDMLDDLGITHLQGFGISRPARQLVGLDGAVDEGRGARRTPLRDVSIPRRS
jgi:EAL domain-containing protein (putative c-di-GMP-specific phosphodiesterase class I)